MLRPLVKKTACFILSLAAVFFFQAKTATADSSVVFNEIAWMGSSISTSDEWMELYNNTGATIDLTGWKIIWGADNKYTITLAGQISANGYFLLERTNEDSVVNITADQIYVGALTNSGDDLKLYNGQNNLVDEINASSGWPAGDNTQKSTMEKTFNGLWQNSANPNGTPKTINSAGAPTPTPTPSAFPTPSPDLSPATPSPSVSPISPISQTSPIASSAPTPSSTAPAFQFSNDIFLNEFMPNPGKAELSSGKAELSLGKTELSSGKDEKEWIELYNNGDETVNLTGWQIDDAQNSRQPKLIPENTILKPKEFLAVYFDNGLFNNDSDEVHLLWPDDQVLHSVAYKNAPAGSSSARFGNQWFWTNQPTPGADNKKSANNQAGQENSTANLALTTAATVQTQIVAETLQETISEPTKEITAQKSPKEQSQNSIISPTNGNQPTATGNANPPAQDTADINIKAAIPGPQNSNLKTYLLIILLFLGSGAAGLSLIYLKRKTSRQAGESDKKV